MLSRSGTGSPTPCHFLWMSATLGESLLRTKDRENSAWRGRPGSPVLARGSEQREPAVEQRLAAEKGIDVEGRPADPQEGQVRCPRPAPDAPFPAHPQYGPGCTGLVPAGPEGLQTVTRTLRPEAILLHSRFRPPDRQRHMGTLAAVRDQQSKETGAVSDHPGLSSSRLKSLRRVSTFRRPALERDCPLGIGRATPGAIEPGRETGGATATFWMPDGTDENDKGAPNESKKKRERIGPYLKKDLETAKKLLEAVRQRMDQDGEGRAVPPGPRCRAPGGREQTSARSGVRSGHPAA